MTQSILEDTTIEKSLDSVDVESVRSDVQKLDVQQFVEQKKWFNPSIWIFFVLFAVAGFILGRFDHFGNRTSESLLKLEPTKTKRIEADGDSVVVTSVPVMTRDVERTIQAVGTLSGFEEFTVSSKLDGSVKRILCDVSSRVRPGDVLLELDTTEAALSVRQSEMSLLAELSKWGFQAVPEQNVDVTKLPSVVTAKLRWELAQSRLNRVLPLQSTNSITAEDIEQAKSESKVTESEYQNQLLQARSSVAIARLKAAELDIAKQRLTDCQIKVPTPSNTLREEDGFYTVSERLVSEGSLLRPGTEVFRLVLGRSMKLKLSVPQVYAAQVCVGQSVSITVDSYDEKFNGVINRVAPAIDRVTRTLMVEVDVPNSDGRLKAGSFAKASISTGKSADAICVPLESVSSFAGIQKIFLIENHVAREVKVSLGEQSMDWVEIKSPKIRKDARVITSGQRLLSDESPVRERLPDSSNSLNDTESNQSMRSNK